MCGQEWIHFQLQILVMSSLNSVILPALDIEFEVSPDSEYGTAIPNLGKY